MTTTAIETVHLSVDVTDGIASVVMDRQGGSQNTLFPEFFGELEAVIDLVEGDPGILAVVWSSAKRDFLAGADLEVLAGATDPEEVARASRQMQQIFDRLEGLTTEHGKPVVAAISGAALGGGLELALACSYRIAADDPRTQLGFPEVQLGLLPAGGGTQRAPGVVGIVSALDLILSGRALRAGQARKMGLVDEVVPATMLQEIAWRRAAELAGGKAESRARKPPAPERIQQLALEGNPVGRRLLFTQARAKMRARTGGHYPAPPKALEAVRIGVEDGRDAGLEAEARFFGELALTPESKALRSIFFATRELEKETWVPAGVEPQAVTEVAVLGGGLMGGGIAAVSSLKAGSRVRIKEVDPAGVARGLAYVGKVVDGRVKKRRMRAFDAEKAMLRVTGSVDWQGFAGTDLVIEAVFEDLELKRAILREVEGVVTEETVFASNTSTIPIGLIAEASSRPETVLGMHYFSPVEKMPLLEVIVTDRTADWALATAVAFGKAQGKTVIVVNDGTGFYTSRVVAPYGTEAMYLLEEGASIDDIDGAMTAWGFPVGPILLQDEIGLDVAGKIAPIMIDAYGERMRGPAFAERFAAGERKGRKNRKGFYTYDEKGKRGDVDESVYAALGLGSRVKVPREAIQRRVSLAFVNEAARCLEEGILRSARDGDIGAIMGLGFPPFRGGPFTYVDQVGAAQVVAWLEELEAEHGTRFTPAAILRDKAADGSTFRG